MKARAFTLIALILTISAQQIQAWQGGERMITTEEFFSAVTTGEAAKVKEFLRRDPRLASATDKDGLSAVLKAAYYRKRDVLDLLLATGVELNIFEAAATGSTGRVRELLKRDAGLANAFSGDGFQPLGLATFFSHKETVEALLEAGAGVNLPSRNKMKVTPLHSAAAARQVEIARLLIARGADVNVQQEGGLTPLHEAAANGQLEFARLLLDSGADVNRKSERGKTALTYARETKQAEMITFLRGRGATE